ncbi:Tetraacyldisaccharide 4'-kinase [Citrifermentans bremense]|uniref:Tetraacyldisaccharide 4'-kinase n=2 Tax=Citrifermentans bremense TaxID=60035 RepID=A0A6S6M477_9BACT|nr:Tetraacyldisaccharide 4'-kinase [Citrifermentans bremense]
MADFELYFKELMDGKRAGWKDRLALAGLRLASLPYALALRARALGYASGLIPSHRLPRPVISVGNITLGGTGKTPTVAWLASYLIGRGKKVAVLSRGYGGSAEGELRIVSDGKSLLVGPEEAGDEPCLLARKVPGLMVVTGADRYRAGLLALKELAPDVFILDDGFQHLKLKRDLNLLLLDCRRPFGNERVLPAGYLREPKSAVKRADLVLFTRCQPDGAPQLANLDKPVCHSMHRLNGCAPLEGGEPRAFAELKGERAMAFAGIADPAGFFDSLEKEGVQLVTTLAFSDHICYGDAEIAAVLRLKKASRSTFMVTTEKDAVKLAPFKEQLGTVYVARLDLEPLDAPLLQGMVDRLVANGQARALEQKKGGDKRA